MVISYIQLGQRIKTIRKKKGISQAQLAEKIDCSAPYMSYIESGYKGVSIDKLVAIANALNVSSDDLLVDSLENTVKVFNHEFANIVSDCSEYELKILLDVVRYTKIALRENRYLISGRRK